MKSAPKNMSIALCRSFATIMIVICHFGTAYGYSFVGQFFQSGVQVFILISGVLYSSRSIDNNIKRWLLNRWKRVCVPCYIHAAWLVIICTICDVTYNWKGLTEIILNVEGYHHFFTFIPNPWIMKGTGHFWFVTVICLCYGLVALIKKRQLDKWIHERRLYIFLLIFVISILTGFVGLRLDYFVIFLFGYMFSEHLFHVSKKELLFGTGCFMCAVILRLAGKIYCDVYGDNNIYLYVLIPISYNLLAYAAYCYINMIGEILNKLLNKQRSLYEKCILAFDSLTFYIFITHYMYIDGPNSLIDISASRIISITCVLVATFVSSMVLKSITHFLNSRMISLRSS